MAENGVDGAFLQRFLGATDMEGGDDRSRNLRDEIGDRVQEAAEKEGRVFAIMYVLWRLQYPVLLDLMTECTGDLGTTSQE